MGLLRFACCNDAEVTTTNELRSTASATRSEELHSRAHLDDVQSRVYQQSQ
jgi:hypothetical protein